MQPPEPPDRGAAGISGSGVSRETRRRGLGHDPSRGGPGPVAIHPRWFHVKHVPPAPALATRRRSPRRPSSMPRPWAMKARRSGSQLRCTSLHRIEWGVGGCVASRTTSRPIGSRSDPIPGRADRDPGRSQGTSGRTAAARATAAPADGNIRGTVEGNTGSCPVDAGHVHIHDIRGFLQRGARPPRHPATPGRCGTGVRVEPWPWTARPTLLQSGGRKALHLRSQQALALRNLPSLPVRDGKRPAAASRLPGAVRSPHRLREVLATVVIAQNRASRSGGQRGTQCGAGETPAEAAPASPSGSGRSWRRRVPVTNPADGEEIRSA